MSGKSKMQPLSMRMLDCDAQILISLAEERQSIYDFIMNERSNRRTEEHFDTSGRPW
jgi:hypothetical protein